MDEQADRTEIAERAAHELRRVGAASRQRLAPGEVVDELLRGASGAARRARAPSAAPPRGSARAAPRAPRASA